MKTLRTSTSKRQPIKEGPIRNVVHESKYDELKAIVVSGSYFVTLATQLDEVKNRLRKNKDNHNEVVRLEGLVDQLLYVQSSYKLKSRKKARR
jgi:hypothetical protein